MKSIHEQFILALMLTVLVVYSAPGAGTGQIASLVDSDVDNALFSTSAEGYTTVMFGEQAGMPVYSAGTLIAQGGAFSGDFGAAGIAKVGFRIRSETAVNVPVSACLLLKGTSGRTWLNSDITVSNVQGKWMPNNVGFTIADGWTRSGSGDLETMLAEDVASVEYIGLRFKQRGKEAQSYTVDTFTLLDASGAVVGESGLLPSRVMAYYQSLGVSSVGEITEEMKNMDSDSDGMSDWSELMAGTDPLDRNSIFAAKITDYKGDGITIEWPCVSDGIYDVLKKDGFTSDFSVIGVGLQAGYDGAMSYKDSFTPGRGPYMYKVIKR